MMAADLFCHERAARFEREIRELRARAPEPGIEPRVTPAELDQRDFLAAVFGRGVR
jgi:hypothetical protein